MEPINCRTSNLVSLNEKSSDSLTTIQELKNEIEVFCKKREWDPFHSAKDLAIGAITEAAELLEHFRFRSFEESESLFHDTHKKQLIEEELADVFYFVIRFSQKYNIDLSQVLRRKMIKNESRYPVEKSKGNNKKYNEL